MQMSQTLQAAPSSGAVRGEATIQPAYFTSSLFVDALRADVRELEQIFSKHYYAQVDALAESNENDRGSLKPFSLFKNFWSRLGWQWLHLKVLEPRARETFLNVVFRLFLECAGPSENPMLRVVGLFALYTFYMSQPSTPVPKHLHTTHGILIPTDSLESLLELPESLTGRDSALKPYVQFVLETLRPRFLMLPPSELQAQNPSVLPREEVRNEIELEGTNSTGAIRKKTGRPSKAEKAQKMRTALTSLDRWLDKSSYPSDSIPGASDPAGAAGLWIPREEAGSGAIATAVATTEPTTHITLSQRPMVSLNSYREKKAAAVTMLQGSGHGGAVDRASSRVLRRLKEIDAVAAERGLEVGTEGGELSAIGRVETAVNERRVLSLLEGGAIT